MQRERDAGSDGENASRRVRCFQSRHSPVSTSAAPTITSEKKSRHAAIARGSAFESLVSGPANEMPSSDSGENPARRAGVSIRESAASAIGRAADLLLTLRSGCRSASAGALSVRRVHDLPRVAAAAGRVRSPARIRCSAGARRRRFGARLIASARTLTPWQMLPSMLYRSFDLHPHWPRWNGMTCIRPRAPTKLRARGLRLSRLDQHDADEKRRIDLLPLAFCDDGVGDPVGVVAVPRVAAEHLADRKAPRSAWSR